MRAAILIVSFFASMAFADGYNDNFDTNPLNLHWGASLEEVKAAYPGGLTWPTNDKTVLVNYTLAQDSEVYWGGIPAKEVTISFTLENKLYNIFFQFDYANNEEVKRRSLEIFGASKKINEANGVHKTYWKSPQGVSKMLSVNATPAFEWVFFGVEKMPEAGDGKKATNQ